MDTKGWDIIYIAGTKKCNENLAKNMSGLISGFDYEHEGIKLTGTFSNWKIVNGGSDKYVHFEMPIEKGSLNVNGNVTDLAGVTPIMSIKLDFVANPQNEKVKNLIFNLDGEGPTSPSKNVSTIAVDARAKDATITPKKNPVAWGVMNTSLPEIFMANKDKLSYVFAQINLVPPQSSGWTAPKEIDFAYLDANEGFFVVFTCVESKDTSSLPRVPDTSILDTTNDLYVCMSEKMLLQHLIQPGLPNGFGHGATAGNFKYKAVHDVSGQMEIGQIVNVGNIATDTAKWGLDTYYPKITSLNISVKNNQLHIEIGGDFDITGLAGASCSFTVTLNNTFTFDESSQLFSFAKDPNPNHTYNKHIPWYDWVFVAPFLLGLLALILELVTNAVTSSVSSSISGSQNAKISANLNNTVAWTGIENTKFSAAVLSQALCLKSNN